MTVRVVSLFCGIGNADAGLYAAAADLGVEVRVVAAYDSWPEVVRVYNANHPPVAQVADVKQMTRDDLPPHDLVIGGPPCQPWSLAGKRGGASDERDCLPDFIRLSTGSAWLMENVVPRLLPRAPFAVKLCASDFGDVTKRKRWFYSDHLLHVVETPGPRRIRDIRDYAEDERVIARRGATMRVGGTPVDDDDFMPSLTGGKGGKGGTSGYPMLHMPGARPSGSCFSTEPRANDDVLGSLTADCWHGTQSGATMLKLGLRGNSASASASAFEDDEFLGSVLSNSFHANEASRLEGCRNPSLLEMARAHSIPDTFDFCGATKTAKGKMIANSWPVGMATAVCRAMLVAMGATAEAAA